MALTTKQSYSSPMSYVGITRRASRLVRVAVTGKPTGWAIAILVVLVPLSLAFVALMYLVLAAWYVVIFGLFGLLTIPFRLFRRSGRKREHLQREQLATMQAMLDEQRRRQP